MKKIFCHKFIAAFISPKITQLLISDPTIDSFCFDTKVTQLKSNSSKNLSNDQLVCSLLQKMINGDQIEISENELKDIATELDNLSSSNEANFTDTKIYSYLNLIESLGNEELKRQFYSNLFLYITNGTISAKNQTKESSSLTKQEIEDKIKKFNSFEQILNINNSLHVTNPTNYNKENITIFIRDYLKQEYSNFVNETAKQFTEIDETLLFKLNPFIFEDVLLSKELTVNYEDSLLNILLRRRSFIIQNLHPENKDEINEDDFYIHHVHFENLSNEGVQAFLDNFALCEITDKVWEGLKKRFILPVQSVSSRFPIFSGKEYFYEDRRDFNGIIKHLSETSGGNIHSNNTIEITCSRFCCGNLEKIVDFNCTDGYAHINDNDDNKQRWIQFDFKSRRVQINSYLIKSSCRTVDDYLKSWKMEISNDGQNWEKADEQDNVTELNGNDKTKLFKIRMTKQFRFIRIFSDKPCFDRNEHCFSIGKIEFYGILDE